MDGGTQRSAKLPGAYERPHATNAMRPIFQGRDLIAAVVAKEGVPPIAAAAPGRMEQVEYKANHFWSRKWLNLRFRYLVQGGQS